jgi:hypothetical protein
MNDYFDQVERGLRAAVRRHAHLPWYVRIRLRHPRALVVVLTGVLVAGPALAAAGLFQTDTQVTSSSCSMSAASTGSRASGSCTFLLSDGRRFRCPPAFGTRPTLSVSALEHAKACSRLPTIAIPAPTRAIFAAIEKARTCLTTQGFRVTGGPFYPTDPPYRQSVPDGELVIESVTPTFIAFYDSGRTAQRFERQLVQNADRLGGRVERRGAVTVLWTRQPAAQQRSGIEACAFG